MLEEEARRGEQGIPGSLRRCGNGSEVLESCSCQPLRFLSSATIATYFGGL